MKETKAFRGRYPKTITMPQLRQVILVFFGMTTLLAHSQKALKKSEKTQVIDQVKALIADNYVFAEQVNYIHHSLDSLTRTTTYTDLNDFKDFADVLTDHLVQVTGDKHFKVQFNPELVQSRREWTKRQQENSQDEESERVAPRASDDDSIDWNLWYAQKENFGFGNIKILEGNIGYMKFDFWQPLDWVRPTIDAAMRFVGHTDALIIDLTENQGGYSPSDSYLGSYFFDEEPTLWASSYYRPTGETASVYTFEELGTERYLHRPVYILVSDQTFSLAEKFAYSMKHFGKAIIIGQTSAGAAHAIDFIEVNDHYLIQLPIMYNIHPVTKTDWEGVGVIPDIEAPRRETLQIAHLTALDDLTERAAGKQKERLLELYEKARTTLANRSTIANRSADGPVKAREDVIRKEIQEILKVLDNTSIPIDEQLNVYAENVVHMAPDHPVITGKASLKTYLEEQRTYGTAMMTHQIVEIDPYDGVVLMRGSVKGKYYPRDGGEAIAFATKNLFVFKRIHGDLKIEKVIYNSSPIDTSYR